MSIWFCFCNNYDWIMFDPLEFKGNLHLIMHQCFIVHIDIHIHMNLVHMFLCPCYYTLTYYTLRWYIKTYVSRFSHLWPIIWNSRICPQRSDLREILCLSYIIVCLPTKVIIKLIREKINENSGGLGYQFSDISSESSMNACKQKLEMTLFNEQPRENAFKNAACPSFLI